MLNKQHKTIMKKFYTRFLAVAAMAMTMSGSAMAQNRAVYLSTSSKMDFSKVTEMVNTVKVSRMFFEGYNTICLPFSVSAQDLKTLMGEDVMLEKLAQQKGSTLTFIDVTEEGIEAGMPYLIFSPKSQNVVFSTTDKALTTAPKRLTVGNATMCGKFEASKDMGIYGIPAQQDTEVLQSVLIRTEGDKNFLPTRCGIEFPLSNEIPVISHVTSLNDATPINTLIANNATVDVYAVNGTLVEKGIKINTAMKSLSRGVYVVNGQKFMVK